jgi:uncharacterized membrane protein YvlD (DUF360 family)
MNLNLPPQVRQIIYILTAVASPVMTYLNQAGTVSDFTFGLFAVVMTAVAGLAAFNVDKG